MAYLDYVPELFFVPETLQEANGKAYQSARPASKKKCESGLFHKNGLSAPYYIIRAPNEKAILIGCSGLNTHKIIDSRDVDKLNKAGISLVWMSLPHIDDNKPLLESYLPLAESFFTSRSSPAHALMIGDSPRYALTHSTGGQLFFHLLHDKNVNKKLANIYAGAVHISPYFDTAHASERFSPKIMRMAFEYYMARKPHHAPTERTVSKFYMALSNYDRIKNSLIKGQEHGRHLVKAFDLHARIKTTCGQILELSGHGQRLTSAEHFNIAAAKKIPSIFIIGARDHFACPRTAVYVGKMIDADIMIAQHGFHSPLREEPSLLDKVIKKIQESAEKNRAIRAETTYVSPVPAQAEKPPYDLGIALRDGRRLALQSSARFLYPAASLFQRLG